VPRLFAAAPAYAQSPFQFSNAPDQSAPAVIAADQMTYASDTETITAIGNVTIVQGARALSADQITYQVADDRIIATGSVTLSEPGGETLHADRVELTDQLKRAIADQLRIRLSDGSRLVGSTADRISGDRTVLKDAAFTPCKACAEDPDRAPLWRLRARKVEHDEKAKDLIYEDVKLDIAGLPVFLYAIFQPPGPNCKAPYRLSGARPVFRRRVRCGGTGPLLLVYRAQQGPDLQAADHTEDSPRRRR
jgi:LPS-assembly protein